VPGVTAAFAGATARPRVRPMLEAPTSKDLKIFFTGFLENVLQQDVVAYPISADSKYAVEKMFG
jgi:hypothetical protein